MSSIYSGATRVVGWLGGAADDSDYAIELFTRIGDEIRANDRDISSGSAGAVATFRVDYSDIECAWLLRMPELTGPFWQRLWIIQELVLARELLFL